MGRPSTPFTQPVVSVSKTGWFCARDTGTELGVATREGKRLDYDQVSNGRFLPVSAVQVLDLGAVADPKQPFVVAPQNLSFVVIDPV